jgi:predicted PurR-regulated permease PerM
LQPQLSGKIVVRRFCCAAAMSLLHVLGVLGVMFSAVQGFVDSVQELLQLNPHADDLKHSIADCKDNLKDAGK